MVFFQVLRPIYKRRTPNFSVLEPHIEERIWNFSKCQREKEGCVLADSEIRSGGKFDIFPSLMEHFSNYDVINGEGRAVLADFEKRGGGSVKTWNMSINYTAVYS